MNGAELVVIVSPGRNVEWELDVAADVVADRDMLLRIIQAHLEPDTPVPGHYSVSADRGHVGWFVIDGVGDYEWSERSSLEHLKARVRQATDRDAARAELEDWADLERQGAEVQATRDARLAAGDPAEWERRLADRDANVPDDDMPALLESLRAALARAGGVPPEQVRVGHVGLPHRTELAAEGNRRLRTLLVWAEAADERWGPGSARALVGARLADRLVSALRVPAHGPEGGGDTAPMDSSTLVSRLRSLADFLDGADFAVSWLYVDPTPDGPDDAETRHTVELDGQNGPEVVTNLDHLTDSLRSVDSITAEASTDRVQIEVLGSTTDGTRIRGLATFLAPAAAQLMGALGIDPSSGRSTAPLSLGDLEHLPSIVADPASPGDTPSTPPPDDAQPDPSAPTPSPTTGTDPSAPSPDSPSTEPEQPTTSPTDGGTTPAPDTGGAAGGLSTGSNSDAPSAPSGTPQDGGSPTSSPDPTSTAQDGGATPGPVATGQQPGTPDGAPYNSDGTPVEPTAGSSADVGPDSSATPSAPDPSLPGQQPVQVDETPLPSGSSDPSSSGAGSAEANPSDPTGPAATSTPDSSGQSSPVGDDPADQPTDPDRAARIAELRRQLAELEATGPADTEGGASGPTADVAAEHTDPVPEGGQNLASGQGGGPSGDPAGGGYTTGGASAGTADGY